MSCKRCGIDVAKLRRIREILDEPAEVVRRGRAPSFDNFTDYGRVISVSAATAGVSLSTLSTALGYGKDYVKRVCKGEFKLTRRFALAAGPQLGINLELHIGRGGEGKKDGELTMVIVDEPAHPTNLTAPGLPFSVDAEKGIRTVQGMVFVPGTCAADHAAFPPIDGEPRIA